MPWHVLALLLVLLAPSELMLGAAGSGRPEELLLLAAVAVAATTYGSILLVPLVLRSDIPFSRATYLAAAAIGTVLAFTPYLFTSARVVGIGALATVLAVLILLEWPRLSEATGDSERRVVPTALNVVTLTYYGGLVALPPVDGGASEPLGAGFLLVTGDGTFYELQWQGEQDQLASRRLTLSALIDRADFLAA